MKDVLLVTYAFPPRLGSRSVMVSKLAKYLPDFGWQPTVLTAPPPPNAPGTLPVELPEQNIFRVQPYFERLGNRRISSAIVAQPLENQTLAKTSKKLLMSRRMASYFPWARRMYSLLTWEDLGWHLHSVSTAKTLTATKKFDAMWSASNPPYTVNMTASRIQARTGLPWVAEFPDLWSHENAFANAILPFEEAIEKKVMRNATHLVTVSEPWANTLRKLHAKPVTVIHNGFDEMDYPNSATMIRKPKFTITFTGDMYKQQDPTALFAALGDLKKSQEVSAAEFQMVFYGPLRTMSTVANLANVYGIEDLVNPAGWVSIDKSREEQQTTTLLLLMEWNDTANPGVYSGKLFEYLGARRPILVVGPRGGVIDKLIQETQAGIVLESKEEIANALRKWFKEWRTEGLVKHQVNEDKLRHYTRRDQARRLAELLDSVAADKLGKISL